MAMFARLAKHRYALRIALGALAAALLAYGLLANGPKALRAAPPLPGATAASTRLRRSPALHARPPGAGASSRSTTTTALTGAASCANTVGAFRCSTTRSGRPAPPTRSGVCRLRCSWTPGAASPPPVRFPRPWPRSRAVCRPQPEAWPDRSSSSGRRRRAARRRRRLCLGVRRGAVIETREVGEHGGARDRKADAAV